MTWEIYLEPKDVSSESRAWAAAAHLLPLLGVYIIGPLIIWLIKRDENAFVEMNSREALNFQLSILVYGIVSALLIFVLIGIVLLLAVGLFAFVMAIVAGVKAASGTVYHYPLTIPFVKQP